MTQDIAHDDLAPGLFGLGGHTFGIRDGGGQRLFDEDMGAGVHRGAGIVGMTVGIGRDDNKIGGGLHPLFEGGEARVSLQLRRKRDLGPVHQAHDFGIRMMVMGQCVAHPHVAQTCDQNLRHFTAPDVMPRISCREKMT